MTQQQLDTIVGLVAGLEFALVHVIKAMREAGGISDTAPIAAYLEAQAQALPDHMRNSAVTKIVVRHIVTGLRHPDSDSAEEIGRLLH